MADDESLFDSETTETTSLWPTSTDTYSLTSLPFYQPILTAEARSRRVTNPLFSDEELVKFFPEQKITVFIVTWNMNSQQPPTDLNPIALPESVLYLADLMVFGLQEAPTQNDFFDEWEIELQKTIGPSHVLLHSTTHGALHLAFFVRRYLIWCCSVPEEETHNTSSPCAVPFLKTKGCIAVSFQIFGTSFLFINSHFPAHESQNRRRVEEYEKVITSINLPKNLERLKTRYVTRDLTGRFDLVFWFGDFNFRVDLPYDQVTKFLYENKSSDVEDNEETYGQLLEYDQLLVSMKTLNIFRGFNESMSIRFPPTYKFEVESNVYDIKEKRVPSYTDRILFRTKRLGHVHTHQYNCVSQFQTSDHRPVFGLFEAKIRQGSEDVPLNAGKFRREVYIEGLKRRAIEAGRSDIIYHSDCLLS